MGNRGQSIRHSTRFIDTFFWRPPINHPVQTRAIDKNVDTTLPNNGDTMAFKRRFLSFAGAGFLAAVAFAPTNALAAGKIISTGIKAIDDVFEPAAGVITDLEASKKQLADSRKKILRALGAKEGSDIAVAVEAFAKKAAGQIRVEMTKKEIQLVDKEKLAEMKAKVEEAKAKAGKGGKKKKQGGGFMAQLKAKAKAGSAPTSIKIPFPSLAVAEGASGSVIAAVDAINEALDSTVGVMATVMSVPGKLQATIVQAALLPLKAPKQIEKAGLSKEAGKKVMAGLKANVKVVAILPKEALACSKEVKNLLAVVSGIAGGAAKAGGEEIGVRAFDIPTNANER
jgi:hypothetical protein